MLKTNTERKELKTMGHITPLMDHLHKTRNIPVIKPY